MLDQDAPKEQIIVHAPLMVFEILSPEDTATRMFIKLADCGGMGIEGIFVIDPPTDTYYVYRQGNLDQIGGPCAVRHCQIEFDEIKVLLA